MVIVEPKALAKEHVFALIAGIKHQKRNYEIENAVMRRYKLYLSKMSINRVM